MLLHSYHDIDYIFSLDADVGAGLIQKAIEREKDDRFFLQWCVQLPFMGKEDFISYPEYKKHITGADIDQRPAEMILAELDEVEEELKKGGKENGA